MDEKELKQMRQNTIESRKKNFKVKVVNPAMDAELYPGAVDLEITGNGSSWTSIRLMPDEVPKVIEALQKSMGYATNANIKTTLKKIEKLAYAVEDAYLKEHDYYAWVVKHAND